MKKRRFLFEQSRKTKATNQTREFSGIGMGSSRVSLIIIFIFFLLIGCSPGGGGGLNPIIALLGGGTTENPGNPGEPGPGTPGWIKASDGSFADRVELEWESVDGASYSIFRRASGQSEFQQIGTSNSPNFTDTTLETGRSYQYSVSSTTGGVVSSLSFYDLGWKASSSGCAAKLNPSGTSGSLVARFPGSFGSNLSSVAASNDSIYIGHGNKINLLNRNRDVIGVWSGLTSISIAVDGLGNAYALTSSQIFRLLSNCETSLIATLPADSVPTDIATDSTGSLYVSESNFSTGSDRIFKLSSSGTLLKTWDLPGSREPKAIHVLPGDTDILVGDEANYDLSQYKINGDQLDLVISRDILVGTIIDLTMSGIQILVVVQSNTFGDDYGPNLIRFHSGINQGSAISNFNPDGQEINTHRIRKVALDPSTSGVLAVDSSNGTLYSCPSPLFLGCGEVVKSVSPIRTGSDESGNLYVLHSNFISKHNSNGAHLRNISLPLFSGRPILGKDLEIEGNTLYVSGSEDIGGTRVLARIKTDLSSSQANTFQADIGFGRTNIAIANGTVFNDVLTFEGDDTLLYIGSVSSTGGVVNYSGSTIRKVFIQETYELETDAAGNLYSFFDGFNETEEFVAVYKFNVAASTWTPLADATDLPHLQIGTDKLGNLYSVDRNAGNTGYDLVQRDGSFTEKKRLSLGAGLTPGTLYVGNPERDIYLANSDGLHRFAFPIPLF